MRGTLLLLTLSLLGSALLQAQGPGPSDDTSGSGWPAPPAARAQPVEEVLHGERIVDPYRWLETDSAETQAFQQAELAYTRAYLDRIPARTTLRQRLGDLLAVGTLTSPDVRGPRLFYTRRDAGQNQPVLYAREGLRGPDRALVDVNALSPDATIALDWWHASEDGRFVAYGTSPGGSEVSELRVVPADDGPVLPEVLFTGRGGSVAWLPDSSGFYYSRYPKKGEVPAGQEAYHRRIWFHRLGTDQARDVLVFGEGRAPQDWPSATVSRDGRWLLVSVGQGTMRSELYLKDLRAPESAFVPVAAGKDSLYRADMHEGFLYVTTNEDAPRYRVLRVPLASPARANWKELIPQSSGPRGAVLQGVQVAGGRLFATYGESARSVLKMFSLDGKALGEVALPGIGTVTGVHGEAEGSEAFYAFESFTTAPTVYRYDVAAGRSEVWEQVKADVDPRRFEVSQVWYRSKDGTEVPMFVVARAGLQKSGRNPTLLHGYGGFNAAETPTFRRPMLAFVEQGGVYAVANLRGGDEFGEDWHRAGMLDKKQNVFDDFIAAGEYLIAQKYTDRGHLCAYGRSNGGLLAGAVLTQRPDLFKAVVVGVPLLDMLRYQNFQIARLWIPEYGSAENPRQFPFLRAYSPYHHVKEQAYPATLLFTSDGDTRVDPMHARKMTALLRAKARNGPEAPILLRIDPRAGHGAGKPVSKQVEEWADIWAFVLWQLGVSAPGPRA
jgi:prolyl oligopeptidase